MTRMHIVHGIKRSCFSIKISNVSKKLRFKGNTKVLVDACVNTSGLRECKIIFSFYWSSDQDFVGPQSYQIIAIILTIMNLKRSGDNLSPTTSPRYMALWYMDGLFKTVGSEGPYKAWLSLINQLLQKWSKNKILSWRFLKLENENPWERIFQLDLWFKSWYKIILWPESSFIVVFLQLL